MPLLDISTFNAALPPHGRLIALDVGKKRVGVAVSDAMRMVATGQEKLARQPAKAFMAALEALYAQEAAVGMLIGLPLSMDGSDSSQTQSVRQLAKNIEQQYDWPLLLWDERLSTVAAERAMIEADLSRAKRKSIVDQIAAAYILQGYLNSAKHNISI